MAPQRTPIDTYQYEAPLGTAYPGFTSGMIPGGTPLARTASIAVPVATWTISRTPLFNEEIVLMDATSGALTCTLPTAVPQVTGTGRRFTVVKIDSSGNAVTVATTSAQTINGSATASLAAQWNRITVVSNGTNWVQIA